MEIRDEFIKNIMAEISQKSNKKDNNAASSGFESLMNLAATNVGAKKDNTVDAIQTTKQTQKPKNDKLASNNDSNKQQNKVDNKPNQNGNKKTKESSSTKETSSVETDLEKMTTAEKDAIKKLAQILDMPVESVMDILASLNMQIFDLANTENLNTFLQAAFSVESPVELLVVEDIAQMIGDIKQIFVDADEAVKIFEQIKAMQPTEEIEVATENVKVDTETQSVMAETTVKAEVLKEQPVFKAIGQEETVTETLPERAVKAVVESGEVSENSEQNLSGENFQKNQSFETPIYTQANVSTESLFNSVQASENAVKNISTRNINTADVIKQITDNLKVEIKGNISEIKITLRPEDLGDVTLKISTNNGIISAKFVAENERVKEIIESNFNQLRDSLEEKGLGISELSVSVGQNEEDRMQQFMFEQEKASARINQILKDVSDDIELEEAVINTKEIYDNEVEYTV